MIPAHHQRCVDERRLRVHSRRCGTGLSFGIHFQDRREIFDTASNKNFQQRCSYSEKRGIVGDKQPCEERCLFHYQTMNGEQKQVESF